MLGNVFLALDDRYHNAIHQHLRRSLSEVPPKPQTNQLPATGCDQGEHAPSTPNMKKHTIKLNSDSTSLRKRLCSSTKPDLGAEPLTRRHGDLGAEASRCWKNTKQERETQNAPQDNSLGALTTPKNVGSGLRLEFPVERMGTEKENKHNQRGDHVFAR